MNPCYKDYMLKSSSRVRETVEWCIHYSFNSEDTTNPRVFLIGDSICNGYAGISVGKLENICNVTYWASSKCVTDPFYLRELDFYLDYFPYDVICFNNGLHSLVTDREEWTEAYCLAVDYILAKLPNTKLYLTLSTPLKDPKLTAISNELNEIVKKIAAERGLEIIDMFTPMDIRDRETDWSDVYHFNPPARDEQANIIAEAVKKALNNKTADIAHAESETGPDGAIK